MEYVDLTQAAQKTLQASAPPTSEIYDYDQAYRLRRKMLGVLIRRCRLAAERTLEDCARFLGVESEQIEAWELGTRAPNLPQLERLAACLDRDEHGASANRTDMALDAGDEYFRLRRRIIGAQLQHARLAREQSLEGISALTGLQVDVLRAYEYGEASVPVHHLTMLAQVIGRDLQHFADPGSDMRADVARQKPELPTATANDAELKAFAADMKNRAFIRLAMAFRDINRDDLHRIADALCVIIEQRRDANGRRR